VPDVREGRWSVQSDDDVVVFIIGAKVRNPLRAMRALPLLAQMRGMLTDLAAAPDKGLLAFQSHGGPFGVIVQYWRSFDDLERFARSAQDRHAGVWKSWSRLGQHHNPSVGIWHETYRVRAGDYEAIYQNMPPTGLGRAGGLTPVGPSRESARERIAAAR
jgi:fumigallin biosynthesis monooxygenase-like protein